jgi:hypothetical protein
LVLKNGRLLSNGGDVGVGDFKLEVKGKGGAIGKGEAKPAISDALKKNISKNLKNVNIETLEYFNKPTWFNMATNLYKLPDELNKLDIAQPRDLIIETLITGLNLTFRRSNIYRIRY